MPATVYRGTNASITNGPTELNIHSWVAWVERPQYPVTAGKESAQVTVEGDPIGRMVIIGTANGNTIPTAGDLLTSCQLKTNTSGTAVTNNWRCTKVEWQIEKRAGGPPQMLQTEWVTTDTSPTGIMA